jgi:cobalamin synthase
MPIIHRFILCLLSSIVACGGATLIGAGHPAEKLLHEWYTGVLALFLIFFVILMSAALRGGLERSFWAIPISATLCYPAAAFAYIVYFSSFEPQRFANAVNQVQSSTDTSAVVRLFDIILLIFFIGPTISLAWLFGVLAGIAFLLIGRLALRFWTP